MLKSGCRLNKVATARPATERVEVVPLARLSCLLIFRRRNFHSSTPPTVPALVFERLQDTPHLGGGNH